MSARKGVTGCRGSKGRTIRAVKGSKEEVYNSGQEQQSKYEPQGFFDIDQVLELLLVQFQDLLFVGQLGFWFFCHFSSMFACKRLAFTADSITVAIEVVRIGAHDFESPEFYVFAVQVRRWRRDADVGVGR
jgi:hypothetical protein